MLELVIRLGSELGLMMSVMVVLGWVLRMEVMF